MANIKQMQHVVWCQCRHRNKTSSQSQADHPSVCS